MSGDVWTFDRFAVGAPAGRARVVVDGRRVDLWRGMFGPVDAGALPEALLLPVMMEAYIAAIQPRPKGNVHAGQTLDFADRPVPAGAALDFAFACANKELKGERRWVWFDVEARHGDDRVATGTITAIWAR